MRGRTAIATLACAASAFASYTYDYTANPVVSDSARWASNGKISFQAFGATFGGVGGSLISIPAISGANSSDYEVSSTLAIKSGGGTYIHFLRADSTAASPGAGNYISAELVVPTNFTSPGMATLNINQTTAGITSLIGSAGVMANDGMTFRTVIFGSNLWVFINNTRVFTQTLSSVTTGNPGIGGVGNPAGSGFAGVSLGRHDIVAPTAVGRADLTTSTTGTPAQVLFRWAGTVDDADGVGVWSYTLSRQDPNTGQYSPIATVTQADTIDNSISASTSFNYSLVATDYHGNASTALLFTIVTPPSQAVDPRRPGVRSNGVYWGGGPEQIDILSGNLNFTLPLIRPQGRTGWSVPVNLTYDSQNWRQDSGTNWKYGYSREAGFGWKVTIGSLTPYYSFWYNGPDHYVFTDATGAEYRLDVPLANGVWTSKDGAYVWYESSTNQLHFKDGSFWIMGSTSGGPAQDAGSLYPTVLEDVNGNQILVNYLPAPGFSAANTSFRINTIEDVRGKGSASYTFTYSNGALTAISNSIGTNESWTFAFGAAFTLNPPFGPDSTNFTSTQPLATVTGATGAGWNFSYDPSGTGELTQVTFPDGGHVRWTYGTATYSGNRLLREVSGRYVANTAGAAEWGPYTFSHDDSQNPNPTVHANTTLVDASGVGAKTWKFTLPDGKAAAWTIGLPTDFLQTTSAGGAVLTHDSYSWNVNAAQIPYVASKTTTLDEGTTGAKTMSTAQVLDQYGNVTSQTITDYPGKVIRTYTNTYLHASSPSYANAYIRNRLASSSLADGQGNTVTLGTNTYDGVTLAAPSGTPMEFDAAQGAATNRLRGLVTQTVSRGQTLNFAYDTTGTLVTGTNVNGTGTSAAVSTTTNFAAPDTITPLSGTADVMNGHSVSQASGSSLMTSYTYNPSLALANSVSPNSATSSQTFSPTTGLLTSSVSVHGATTNYAYTFNPTTVTATTNGHWTKSYKDGFGRDLAIESGYGSTIVSHVDYTYGPCACSPLGKVTATSAPYAIGAGGSIIATDGTSNIAWTTWTYDGTGRTLKQTAPDNSVTRYLYAGNTTKVTDPAGNWKRFTNDALGNLILVEEPNPAYGQADSASTNFSTSYAFDLWGHLASVSMPRPNGGSPYTQTRTFQYDLATGRLLSATNPENGTVSYAYYTSGRLQSKTNAKGQKVLYSYDGYGRVAYIDRYPDGVNWDPCQSVRLTYDQSSNNTNGMGRLSQADTGAYWAQGSGDTSTCNGNSITESYSYTAGGLMTRKGYGKTWPVSLNPLWFTTANVGTSYSWDQEGHMTGYGPFTYTLDAMGRPTALTETGPGTVWVQNAAYGPGGELQTLQYRTGGGNQFSETRQFNNRSQVTQIQVTSSVGKPNMNLQYGYTAGANNGEIATSKDMLSGEQVTYTYDALKRLIQAETTQNPTTTAWGQAFGYDGFGNLLTKNPTKGHTGTTMALTVDASTNQITTAGFGYDANGNMTSMPTASGNVTLNYDVENRTGGTWFDQQNQPLDRAGGMERVWVGGRTAGDGYVRDSTYCHQRAVNGVLHDNDPNITEHLLWRAADRVERDGGGYGPAGVRADG